LRRRRICGACILALRSSFVPRVTSASLGVIEQVPVDKVISNPPRRWALPWARATPALGTADPFECCSDAPEFGATACSGSAAWPPRRLSRRTVWSLRPADPLFASLLVPQLDKAFVAVGRYLGEGEDFVFREHVGDHRGPVIIPLDRFRTQDLGRPAARPGIHRVVASQGAAFSGCTVARLIRLIKGQLSR
jgi:hypothetical protein